MVKGSVTATSYLITVELFKNNLDEFVGDLFLRSGCLITSDVCSGGNPVNLGTRMFLNWVTRFYLTQFLFLFTQFYFYPEIKKQNE